MSQAELSPLLLDSAYPIVIAGYLHIAVFTMWLWDAVISLYDEFHTFRFHQRRITSPDVVYISSRILTGGTVISILAFVVTPHAGCHRGVYTAALFATLALPMNSLLFLIRANAVFRHNRMWRTSLCILWISTFASLTIPFSFDASSLHMSGFCSVGKVHRTVIAGPATIVIFDTMVFFSITREVLSTSKKMGHESWYELFTKGTGRVSQMLLLTGQLYYFPAVTVSIIAMVATISSINAEYQTVTMVGAAAFQNIMACQVFRLLRQGILYEDPRECSMNRTSSSFSLDRLSSSEDA